MSVLFLVTTCGSSSSRSMAQALSDPGKGRYTATQQQQILKRSSLKLLEVLGCFTVALVPSPPCSVPLFFTIFFTPTLSAALRRRCKAGKTSS